MEKQWKFDNFKIKAKKIHSTSNYNISVKAYEGKNLIGLIIIHENSKDIEILHEGLCLINKSDDNSIES